ncbi:MAG: DUF6445 family protein [Caldimonas sp.]
MSKTAYQRFLCIRDGFYEDLGKVYRKARTANYIEHEFATGVRSSTVYHEAGVRQKLERFLGLRITRWDTDPAHENGVFYIGAAQGRLKEMPGIHIDHPNDDVTVVIYLTPGLPPDCGTSLWQHRRTGLADAATPADARRLTMRYADLLRVFERDARIRERWIELDRIAYKPNRMVAYPSGVFHSASRHHGSSVADARLYQTFRVGVDWVSQAR